MNVALDGGEQYLSGFFGLSGLLGLDVRLQDADGLLHRACRLHHLGQEHLAAAEAFAHGVHAVHERSLDDVDGSFRLL